MANPNERILNLQREPIIVDAGGAVNSVNGQTGDVVLTAEDVGALPDSTAIPSKTSDLENDSNYQTGDEVNQAIGLETTARENADINLQGQIDALSAASDVTDIVGTYADLQAYDTSKLKDNDIIKVLQDESRNDETTYYRWSISTETFTLIGEEGPYYTKAAADQKFQDKLTAGSNITIDASNEISATDTTYSNFVGTDGQTAGTAGLVPAPATTDAGKYLKADGTWDSIVIPQSGIPTDATAFGVPYNVTTKNFQLADVPRFTISNWSTMGVDFYPNGAQTGQPYLRLTTTGTLSWFGQYGNQMFSATYDVANGYRTRFYYNVWMGNNNDTNMNQIKHLADPTNAQDAATKNYTDNLVINYSAINGASAPTTATEAKYVGQLYYDTTNDDMYYCSAITAQGTTPETYTYTWSQFGGGGPAVVQTTGTSATDVMSQKATTNMIYPSGSETSKNKIVIGYNSSISGDNIALAVGYSAKSISGQWNVALGSFAEAGGYGIAIGSGYGNSTKTVAGGYSVYQSVAIGFHATANQNSSVAIGAEATTTRSNEFSIGKSGVTRYIANVTDPTLAQDAATKNYVDSFYPVGTVYTSTSATAPTFAGGTWTEIGTQTIGSSTVHYYERTA